MSLTHRSPTARQDDEEFLLHDLRVDVLSSGDGRPMVCDHTEGDHFLVHDDDLVSFPTGRPFPLFPLAALLPLLAAKTRPLQRNDWMTTDTDIACPDPLCGGVFRITQGPARTYRHSEQSAVELTPTPAT
ncbi:TIGR04076 family protein [Kineococcus sp. SYSU DK001]|uniref:TIGR04076 family protein n=1 Tax=Kineococcus sp. SYSU DK001 TaxID=3383122 RepID=UPI003D7E375E